MKSSLKLLHLNIFCGRCIDKVISFINEMQFDIVHLQEVSRGSFSYTHADCFEEVKRRTGLNGEMVVNWIHKGKEGGQFGNATFFKKSLLLKEQIHLYFRPPIEIDPENYPIYEHPKGALFLLLETKGKSFWCINTHLAWGPTPFDEPYKIEESQKLSQKIGTLKQPFILSGDFNVVPDTQVVKLLEAHGCNVTRKYGITNTLDSNLHKAKHLFPAGLAVDFVITHPTIEVIDLKKVDYTTLSDHIGLILHFDF